MFRRTLTLIAVPLLAAAFVNAQNFDTSGNGSLKGDYFIREVSMGGQNSNGTIISANSVIGVATFDGNGNYTFTGQGFGTGGSVNNQSFTGTYSVGSNGLLGIESFISEGDFCSGGVSGIGPSAFVASATDTYPNPIVVDMLIGIPAGSNTSAASFKGPYTSAYIDFLNADINMIRQASFNATADGAGNLGNLSVTGNAVNLGGSSTSQTVSGATYTLGGEGVGTVNFGGVNSGQLISGSKTLYVSADGNIILGGNPGGFDMLVGIRGLNGPATNATANSVYYVGGLEDVVGQNSQNQTTHSLDAYYGSTNANGAGVAISHNRIVSFTSLGDFTYDSLFSVAPAGTFNDGFVYNYALGANGQAFVATGTSGYYSLVVGFGATKYSGPGVYLNPLGVVNAANFAPITNPIAPYEIVALYGSGLAPSTVSAPSLPLPTILGGVQVTVNGTPAPLVYVTSGQIAFIVPQMISPFFKVANATIQVINNGVKSNAVTVYTSLTAPGVFTAGGNGIGAAAAQHATAGLPLVTSANPAKIGDGVVLYATGLGSVTPSVPDGAGAPSNPLSTVDDTFLEVDFGPQMSTLSFSGLTPGLAGLYQLNTTIPAGTGSGNQFVNLYTGDGSSSEATLPIAGTGTTSILARPHTLGIAGRGNRTDGIRSRSVRKNQPN